MGTKKNRSITNLCAFMLTAALIVAGCGGGGGGGEDPPMMPDPPPEPTAQEMCEGEGGRYNADGSCTSSEELAEEMALYMAAMGYVASAKDPVAMENAREQANMAKGASDAAASAETSAMAEEYQMKAEKYRDAAMEASMERGLGITQLANKIVNQPQINNAELEGAEAPDPRSNAVRVGAALATTADTAPVGPAVGGNGEGSVHQGADTSAAVMRNAAGVITFTVTRDVDDILPGEEPTSLMTYGEKPQGGWPGIEGVRTDTAATADNAAEMTYVNVFTDINPPTQNYAVAATAGAITPGTGVIVAGDIAGDGSNFAATLNINPADNRPPVMGQFQCNTGDTPCSISVDANGRIVANTGYTFHASTGITRQDDDYLAWGVWITVTGENLSDGTFPAGVDNGATAGAFASGSNVFEVKAALKGTATYNGDASGLYSAGGMVEYFDADVSLTANFGGNVGADSTPTDGAGNDGLLIGAVTGSVTNIRAGGMGIEGSLTLGRATILAPPGQRDGNSEDAFRGATSGTLAGRAMGGDWGGRFYGPSNATGVAAETQYPTTAAGTFGAEAPGRLGDPVRILGAFGSWKADD